MAGNSQWPFNPTIPNAILTALFMGNRNLDCILAPSTGNREAAKILLQAVDEMRGEKFKKSGSIILFQQEIHRICKRVDLCDMLITIFQAVLALPPFISYNTRRPSYVHHSIISRLAGKSVLLSKVLKNEFDTYGLRLKSVPHPVFIIQLERDTYSENYVLPNPELSLRDIMEDSADVDMILSAVICVDPRTYEYSSFVNVTNAKEEHVWSFYGTDKKRRITRQDNYPKLAHHLKFWENLQDDFERVPIPKELASLMKYCTMCIYLSIKSNKTKGQKQVTSNPPIVQPISEPPITTQPRQSSAVATVHTVSVEMQNGRQPATSRPGPELPERKTEMQMAPVPTQTSKYGRGKGIQGYENSCFIDSTLMALFYTSDLKDVLKNYEGNRHVQHIADTLHKIKVILTSISNPPYYCPSSTVLELRSILYNFNPKIMGEMMDVEEFIGTLFGKALHAPNFINYTIGTGNYFHQIILGPQDKRRKITGVQYLLRKSMEFQGLKFKEMPHPVFMIKMPRSNGRLVGYDMILPNPVLNLEDCMESGGNTKMELLAVVCLKHMHYTAFIREPEFGTSSWIYFDSMSNGDAEVKRLPHFGDLLKNCYEKGDIGSPGENPALDNLLLGIHLCIYSRMISTGNDNMGASHRNQVVPEREQVRLYPVLSSPPVESTLPVEYTPPTLQTSPPVVAELSVLPAPIPIPVIPAGTTPEPIEIARPLKEIVMSICIALFSNLNAFTTFMARIMENNVSKEFQSCLHYLASCEFKDPGKFEELVQIILKAGLKSAEPRKVISCIFRKLLRKESFLRYSMRPVGCNRMVYSLDFSAPHIMLGRLNSLLMEDFNARRIQCTIATNLLLIQLKRKLDGFPLVVPDDKIRLSGSTDGQYNPDVELSLLSVICHSTERDEFSVYVRHRGVSTSWDYYTIMESGMIGDKTLLHGLMSKLDFIFIYHQFETILNDSSIQLNERIHLQRIISSAVFYVYTRTEGVNQQCHDYSGPIVPTHAHQMENSAETLSKELNPLPGIMVVSNDCEIDDSLGVGLKMTMSPTKALPALFFALFYNPTSLDSILLHGGKANMYDVDVIEVTSLIRVNLADPLRRRHEGSYVQLLYHFRKNDSEYHKMGISGLWRLLCERIIKCKPFVHYTAACNPSGYGVHIQRIQPNSTHGFQTLERQLKLDATKNKWILAGVPKPGLIVTFPTPQFSNLSWEGLLCNLKLDLFHVVPYTETNIPKLQLLAVFCTTELKECILYYRQINHEGVKWVLMDPSHKELKLLIGFEEEILELFRTLTLPSQASTELRHFVKSCVAAIYVH